MTLKEQGAELNVLETALDAEMTNRASPDGG